MPDPWQREDADDLARLVRLRLAEHADPDRAPQMRAYMKSELPYRGVSAVPLRRLLGGLYREHPLPDRGAWEACVRDLWDHAEFREERYAAMALVSHRRYADHQDPDLLPLLRHLITTGAWWDYVDPLASRSVGSLLAARPTVLTPVVRRWAVADDLWLRRTALICQLHRGGDTDLSLLAEAVDANLLGTACGDEFFVRKAIGWALRQHARVDPAWVRAFVAQRADRLSGLSRREALKHL
jgi:3-methyladenine DNA glycosylase AlkD